ncbi:MAG TPA: hypothetical protein VFC18_16760 [Burkholderiales bacterium]|nr:hypothetical protein [Burkholderiales bacterium]
MTRFGLLLTLTEPPAQMEEEFNAWYDTEHLAERLSIPGFRGARRWVADCRPGEGKYLATYELDSPAVLESPAYLRYFNNQTPWSRRCLGKAVVFRRWACEQIEPGNAGPHPQARAVAYGMGELSVEGYLQKRRFAAVSGETITLLEFAGTRASLPAGVLLYRAYGA